MDYTSPLIPAEFINREKRFFLHTSIGTAHCPNTGSLKSILDKPELIKRVWLTDHEADASRKLRYTAEVVEHVDGTRISIHTGRTNQLAEEALTLGLIPELTGHTIKREAKWGSQPVAPKRSEGGTRFDFLLTSPEGQQAWVEVKSVTLQLKDQTAAFPDSPSTRGQKHLTTLMEAVKQGHRAVQLYIVPREGCHTFRPAEAIDPTYAHLLKQAVNQGVEVLCYSTTFTTTPATGTPTAIKVGNPLPIML